MLMALKIAEVAIKEALRQALAQPDEVLAEPVAWAHIENNEIIEFETDKEEREESAELRSTLHRTTA
jgi:hypothetical protein